MSLWFVIYYQHLHSWLSSLNDVHTLNCNMPLGAYFSLLLFSFHQKTAIIGAGWLS